jgi:hypothetical protein
MLGVLAWHEWSGIGRCSDHGATIGCAVQKRVCVALAYTLVCHGMAIMHAIMHVSCTCPMRHVGAASVHRQHHCIVLTYLHRALQGWW